MNYYKILLALCFVALLVIQQVSCGPEPQPRKNHGGYNNYGGGYQRGGGYYGGGQYGGGHRGGGYSGGGYRGGGYRRY